MPGFVDAHVHIESSMLVPSEFARLASCHGTVATVSDPHEIANVLGKEGVRYMIDNGKKVPFKFFFGAPSCVPATAFETAGASLNASDIEELMASDDIYYLSEMMNYPGVIFDDREVMEKIASAKRYGKPIDGHAPAVTGPDLQKYVSAGITTDHECFRLEGALEKIGLGMKILVREGSAAKNFDALIPLMATHPDKLMFCSDDKHPDELDDGHIDVLVRKAIALGYNVLDVLKAASLNAVKVRWPDRLILEACWLPKMVCRTSNTRKPRPPIGLRPISFMPMTFLCLMRGSGLKLSSALMDS